MIKVGDLLCPVCGGELRYYDRVSRIVRTYEGQKNNIKIRRFKCMECNGVHRELPDFIFPYKQYDAEIIKNVTMLDTECFEDGPSDGTIGRWVVSIK